MNKRRISTKDLETLVQNLINDKWKEQFPEDFIHNTTTCHETYISTKGYAYSTRLAFINNIGNLFTTNPDYKVADSWRYKFGEEFQIEQQQKLISDIKNCKNIKIWCIDNIGA